MLKEQAAESKKLSSTAKSDKEKDNKKEDLDDLQLLLDEDPTGEIKSELGKIRSLKNSFRESILDSSDEDLLSELKSCPSGYKREYFGEQEAGKCIPAKKEEDSAEEVGKSLRKYATMTHGMGKGWAIDEGKEHDGTRPKISKEKLLKGEYYADFDKDSGEYCVFHTEDDSGFAFSAESTKEQAEKRAKEMNDNVKKRFNLKEQIDDEDLFDKCTGQCDKEYDSCDKGCDGKVPCEDKCMGKFNSCGQKCEELNDEVEETEENIDDVLDEQKETKFGEELEIKPEGSKFCVSGKKTGTCYKTFGSKELAREFIDKSTVFDEAAKKESSNNKKIFEDFNVGTGRFNKRRPLSVKESIELNVPRRIEIAPKPPLTIDVTIPSGVQDIFVAPPSPDEKMGIIWSIAGRIADHVEEMIENDESVRRLYSFEVPRKAELMHGIIYDLVADKIDKI